MLSTNFSSPKPCDIQDIRHSDAGLETKICSTSDSESVSLNCYEDSNASLHAEGDMSLWYSQKKTSSIHRPQGGYYEFTIENGQPCELKYVPPISAKVKSRRSENNASDRHRAKLSCPCQCQVM